MEKFVVGLGLALLSSVGVVLLACVLPILLFFGGAVSGAVVGWVFDDTIRSVIAYLGLENFRPWQLGGTLAFIGGFFKSSQTNTNKG